MTMFQAGTGSTVATIFSMAVIAYFFYSFIRARKRMNRPPSINVKILDESNFENTIQKGVSLVDFWAGWCAPCKVQGPIIDEVADEIGDRVNICKVDVDRNQKISQTYGIRNIPTILNAKLDSHTAFK